MNMPSTKPTTTTNMGLILLPPLSSSVPLGSIQKASSSPPEISATAFASLTHDLPIDSIRICSDITTFAEKPFIRMMSRIVQILFASSKPTTGQRQETGIFL